MDQEKAENKQDEVKAEADQGTEAAAETEAPKADEVDYKSKYFYALADIEIAFGACIRREIPRD